MSSDKVLAKILVYGDIHTSSKTMDLIGIMLRKP